MNDILSGNFRNRIVGIYGFLVAVNIGAWVWAIIAFHDKQVLMGTAVLAYTFGLRHAVDADHIAAIDNVTRKLMHDGRHQYLWVSTSLSDIRPSSSLPLWLHIGLLPLRSSISCF